jgi:tetrahydromethanopterin S-methyltransferase subunit G
MTDNAAALSSDNKRLDNIEETLKEIKDTVTGMSGKFVSREDLADQLNGRDKALKVYVDESVGKLEDMNKKIDALITEMGAGVKSFFEKVTHIDEKITTWSESIKARDEMAKSNDTRLTNAFEEINQIQTKLADVDKKTDKTESAVFGAGEKDGPPSLFSMISNMNTATAAGITRIETKLDEAADERKENTAMRLQIQAQQATWQKRREKFTAMGVQMFGGNPLFWRFMGGVIVAAATALGYDIVK